MVSFQCDGCADTVKKPQLDKHRQRCWASFSCIDCSTTFQNQDYKSHTSCISEAEKYQGALYKGPRKGQQQNNNNAAAKDTPSTSYTNTPADSPAPSESGASGIHPSRLNQMQAGEPRGGSFAPRGRGGFAARGRGGFAAGRGGYVKVSITGENRARPEGGMRQWGSAPASDNEATPAPSGTATPTQGEPEKKKKRKGGDKGGTGSKANSKSKSAHAPADEPEAAAPSSKKRKLEADDEPAASASSSSTPAPPSDKTLKRLKKHMSKLESSTSEGVSLSQWLQQVAQGKEKSVDQADILAGLKVAFTGGKWQLTV
ncbi:hypothetical protein Q8F55_003688 [Vanrija albida]|uniref:Zinc finger C2H2 LYAR-type domain-containing protein n=1 Tax=Vanrija albida TaxID=181172 RepID=A0ABR3Q501_9TREE